MVGHGKIIKALTYGWYGGVFNLEMFLAFLGTAYQVQNM